MSQAITNIHDQRKWYILVGGVLTYIIRVEFFQNDKQKLR